MWLQTVRNSIMFGCCQIQITFVYRHLYIYQCLSQICMNCDKRSSFGLCQLPATEAIVARESKVAEDKSMCAFEWACGSRLSEIVWYSMMFGCYQIQIAFVSRPVYLSMFIPDLHELRQKKQFRAVSITCNWSYRRQRERWQKTNPCVLLSEHVAPDCQK